MPVDRDLLRQARENPQNIWFDDAVRLAGQFGFQPAGGKGSHMVFHHPDAAMIRAQFPQPLNLQRGPNGKAKRYQVQQMLQQAAALGVVPDDDED
jgi:hypothetical protein